MPSKRDMTGVEPEQPQVTQDQTPSEPASQTVRDDTEPRSGRVFYVQGVRIAGDIEKWAREHGERMCLVEIRTTIYDEASDERQERLSKEWWPACFAEYVREGFVGDRIREQYRIERRREPRPS